MKKIIAIGSIMLSMMFIVGCGNSWELTKKNFKSDYSDLYRHVKVYDSISKDVIWEYTGVMYMNETSKPGDVSIVYRHNGKYFKNDFVGQHIQVVLMEVSTFN